MVRNEHPSMTPVEFGRELRRLREVAGVALEDIASETKISPHVLTCLEQGQFSRLPQRVFCRNFVRQIAATIGCDPDRLVGMFDTAWNRYQVSSGSHPGITVVEAPPRRVIRLWVWVPVVLIVLVVVVVVFMVLGARSAETPAPAERTRAGRAPAPHATAVPTVPAVGPAAAPAETPVAAEVSLAVEVAEQAECWVRVRDGIGRATQRLLHGGARWEVNGPGPLQLTVGNAAAVTLTVAGGRYRDLGGPGEVRHFRVSRTGLQPIPRGMVEDGGDGGR